MEYKEKEQELERAETSTPNLTGIPTQMKLDFEKRSGLSFDDVRVHYNSDKPAQLQAWAYTQGTQVYVAPGQEKHLSHELGHVIQQKQGIVHPTGLIHGMPINDQPDLEYNATHFSHLGSSKKGINGSGIIQRQPQDYEKLPEIVKEIIRYAIARIEERAGVTPTNTDNRFSSSIITGASSTSTSPHSTNGNDSLTIFDLGAIDIDNLQPTERQSGDIGDRDDIDDILGSSSFQVENIEKSILNKDTLRTLRDEIQKQGITGDSTIKILNDIYTFFPDKVGEFHGPSAISAEASVTPKQLMLNYKDFIDQNGGGLYNPLDGKKFLIINSKSNAPSSLPQLVANTETDDAKSFVGGKRTSSPVQNFEKLYGLYSIILHELGHRAQDVGLTGWSSGDFEHVMKSPGLMRLAEYENVLLHENLLPGRQRTRYNPPGVAGERFSVREKDGDGSFIRIQARIIANIIKKLSDDYYENKNSEFLNEIGESLEEDFDDSINSLLINVAYKFNEEMLSHAGNYDEEFESSFVNEIVTLIEEIPNT